MEPGNEWTLAKNPGTEANLPIISNNIAIFTEITLRNFTTVQKYWTMIRERLVISFGIPKFLTFRLQPFGFSSQS